MAESLEPKQSLAPKVASFILWAMVIGGVTYLLFFYKPDPDADTFSPSQLRRVIAEYRDHQAERLAEEVAKMQEIRREMEAIRDQWLAEANIETDTASVLETDELAFREVAGSSLEGKDLVEIYDVGRGIEQDTITIYREFLAARTVGLRPGFNYEEAYETAMTPRPTRPDLDREALYRDIVTRQEGGGLDEFKAEIKRSTVETREMLENAKKLLAFTRKSSGSTDDGLSVDLSADDMSMLGYRGPELLPDEIDLTNQADQGNFNAIPGRRLVTGGRMDEWLYIDTWYIIGPFPGDRRRENLDVRFGPEANVNLDDVYTGLDNRKIGWNYKKAGFVQAEGKKTAYWKMEPVDVEAYAIYYAYTEIYSDAKRDVWIATGTDDYGKLWINDKLVWRSPQGRKPYNATENIQQITLEQGQNKVLYRVENAGGTMGFSLMMRLMGG